MALVIVVIVYAIGVAMTASYHVMVYGKRTAEGVAEALGWPITVAGWVVYQLECLCWFLGDVLSELRRIWRGK